MTLTRYSNFNLSRCKKAYILGVIAALSLGLASSRVQEIEDDDLSGCTV